MVAWRFTKTIAQKPAWPPPEDPYFLPWKLHGDAHCANPVSTNSRKRERSVSE